MDWICQAINMLLLILVPKEILKDLDLGGNEDSEPDDSDYTGFIEEPRYVPPATMGPLLEATQPPNKLASTLKPIIGMFIQNKMYNDTDKKNL